MGTETLLLSPLVFCSLLGTVAKSFLTTLHSKVVPRGVIGAALVEVGVATCYVKAGTLEFRDPIDSYGVEFVKVRGE